MSTNTPIVEAEVVEYLNKHPDFFNNHLELLNSLNVPHQSGKAVSLVERQLQALRDSNRQLKERFEQLMDVARDNEKHFENTKQLSLSLIKLHQQQGDLHELMALFDQEFPSMLAAHAHRLILVNYAHETSIPKNVILLNQQSIKESAPKLDNLKGSFCGALTQAEKALIFSDESINLVSFALIPIRLNDGDCFIAIGNRQEKYFYKGMGTLFLDYIAELSAGVISDILHRSQVNTLAV